MILTDKFQNKRVVVITNKEYQKINLDLLDNGIYSLTGEIYFQSNDLTFQPKLILKNGETIDAFKKKIFFHDQNISIFQKSILEKINYFFNFLFFSFFLLCAFILIRESSKLIPYKKFKIFYNIFFIFVLTSSLINIFSNIDVLIVKYSTFYFANKVFSGSFLFGLYLSVLMFFLIIQKKNSNVINLTRKELKYFYIIFVIGAGALYFLFYYFDSIATFKLLPQGDDWWTFEYFAHRIVVLKEYLRAGEDIIMYRPLLRWLSAVFHSLFGQTYVFHAFFNMWSIFIMGAVVAFILNTFQVKNYFVLFSVILLEFFYFAETFKLLIGRGLGEYYSACFLLLATYYLINKMNNLNLFNIIIASTLATLGNLLREDHFPVTICLFFVVLCAYNYKTNLLHLIRTNFKKNYKNFILYAVLVTFGLSLIYIRNYVVSGVFFETLRGVVHSHVNLSNISTNLLSIHTIITGASRFLEIPRTFTLFTLTALFISLFSVFNLRVNNRILVFSIINISIVLPYIFLLNAGYKPRYTIHLLPYTFVLLVLFFNKYFEKWHEKLKS